MRPALSCLRIASSTSRPSLGTALSSDQTKEQDRIAGVFQEFNTAWLVYWDAYVNLQNQLYEAIKAARDVSWLSATDTPRRSASNKTILILSPRSESMNFSICPPFLATGSTDARAAPISIAILSPPTLTTRLLKPSPASPRPPNHPLNYPLSLILFNSSPTKSTRPQISPAT